VEIGDIVSLKELPAYGDCRIENIYGDKDDPTFEVRPLTGPRNSILLGLKTHTLQLVSKHIPGTAGASE
jgi:hypothetical protein